MIRQTDCGAAPCCGAFDVCAERCDTVCFEHLGMHMKFCPLFCHRSRSLFGNCILQNTKTQIKIRSLVLNRPLFQRAPFFVIPAFLPASGKALCYGAIGSGIAFTVIPCTVYFNRVSIVLYSALPAPVGTSCTFFIAAWISRHILSPLIFLRSKALPVDRRTQQHDRKNRWLHPCFSCSTRAVCRRSP